MEQIYNPYLPLTEYVPDGEPHVFGDRLYIYGSHDVSGGRNYCEDHYTVWSAPVNNLKDWSCHGVSYRRDQDPSNADDSRTLYAPDAVQGPDGRYYLYYCFSFLPEIGVAVSNSPAGPFEYYGHVKYPAHINGGNVLHEHMPFDPAVLVDDDNRVYLYYGFAPGGEKHIEVPDPDSEEMKFLPEADKAAMRKLRNMVPEKYSRAAELEPDMITLKAEPAELIPSEDYADGTSFKGHGFFEASSIRKIRGKYYFVYSSHKSHELCYAVSDSPISGYTYGGTLVSNGDIGLDGRQTPVYPLGNNHGGLVQAGEDLYVFYHRQTNGTEFSRQGCAEKVSLAPDGSIAQVEITSCGLNGSPLPASGIYPAGICCHLTDPTVCNRIDYRDPIMNAQVCVTQKQNQVFITRIKDHTVVGYKYFDLQEPSFVLLELRGDFCGRVNISLDEKGEQAIGAGELQSCGDSWKLYEIPVEKCSGKQALYIAFSGEGSLDMRSLGFSR